MQNVRKFDGLTYYLMGCLQCDIEKTSYLLCYISIVCISFLIKNQHQTDFVYRILTLENKSSLLFPYMTIAYRSPKTRHYSQFLPAIYGTGDKYTTRAEIGD